MQFELLLINRGRGTGCGRARLVWPRRHSLSLWILFGLVVAVPVGHREALLHLGLGGARLRFLGTMVQVSAALGHGSRRINMLSLVN